MASKTMGEALSHRSPAVIQAAVDPNEPPRSPKIRLNQALEFGEGLLRGGPNRAKIALTAISDKVREIV